MHKVVLCSVLSVVCFGILAGRNKVNMSRIEAELLIASKRLSVSEKKEQEAYSELKKVDLHKKFRKELKKCKLARNCKESSDFLVAQAALISSDSYAHFSPIHNEFIYDELRHHGLKKMVRYVKYDVGYGDDIEAMRMGAHSALHVDTFRNLTSETAPIRDRVYEELLALIEDSSSGAKQIEKTTPKDQ